MKDQKKEVTMEEGSKSSASAKINRNLIEKKRRNQMKDLFSTLFSVIPTLRNSKLSVPEFLDQATIYTKQLKEKIEKLKERKELLEGDPDFEPVININYSWESTLVEVTIICGLKKNFSLHEVIRVLGEEGAEVVSTTYHNTGHRVFYTIYCKAISSRIGIETSRVDGRLKTLIS